MQSILVIEDEEDIRELVSYNLLKEGYQVASTASGEEGLAAIKDCKPALILLDLMLPGMDGLQVCRILRSEEATAATPVVMLTAKGEEADIVKGLEAGADDYIVKPFAPKVLLARLKAIFRRVAQDAVHADSDGEGDGVMERHTLTIHPGRHEVHVKNKRVELTSTEFRLLRFLARRPGWVYTRHQILQGVHGDDYLITDRAVDVQIVGLRKKLGSAGDLIETVRGVGYRFRDTDS